MLHKAILKGIDNDIYGLLSFMYDDMVNKISKQDAQYTMAQGLEAKGKTKAVEALKRLLEPIDTFDGKKINIGEYIKNKPYLNRIVYNRKYTEGTKTESEGDSIQVQKLKLLSKYKNAKELTKEYGSDSEINKEKYLIDKKIEVPVNLSLNVGERLTPEQVKENKEITERNKPVNDALSKIDKLTDKFFEETKKLSTIKFGKDYEENKSKKEIDPKEAASYDKLKSKLDKDIQKEIDKIDKLKGKKESKTIKVLNEQYKQDVDEFYKKKSLIRNLFDGKKPKAGLLYGDKAKAQLKKIGKVGTPKSTDSSLLQHLNAQTPKGAGKGNVLRRGKETNFDILIFDLRRTMTMILNAFGSEYKDTVGKILELLKKSLRSELDRLSIKDEVTAESKTDTSVKEGTAKTLGFYKNLLSIISGKIVSSDVKDLFDNDPIVKQQIVYLLVNDKNKYRYFLLPRKGGKQLDKSKKPLQGENFTKFDVLENKLTAEKYKELRSMIVKSGIPLYVSTGAKGQLRGNLKQYAQSLEDVFILLGRVVDSAEYSSSMIDYNMLKLKTKIKEDLGRIRTTDKGNMIQFNQDATSFLEALDDLSSEYNKGTAKQRRDKLLDNLSGKIDSIRERIGSKEKQKLPVKIEFSQKGLDIETSRNGKIDREIQKIKSNFYTMLDEAPAKGDEVIMDSIVINEYKTILAELEENLEDSSERMERITDGMKRLKDAHSDYMASGNGEKETEKLTEKDGKIYTGVQNDLKYLKTTLSRLMEDTKDKGE